MPSKDKKYTDPKLREEVKEEIQQGDKGGAPGQWSARKAQMMAKEYKARGGDYTTPKEDKDESQKHLSKWTEEEWQTKDGSAHAKQEDGTRKRYLPKKAWEEMNEDEKEETEKKKQEGSKEGHQFVHNTPRAKSARKNAHEAADQEDEKTETSKRSTRSRMKNEDGKNNKQEPEKTNGSKDDEKDDEQPGKKRSRAKSSKADEEKDTKKQKSNSGAAKSNSNKDDAPAAPGSSSRLPKKGQKAHWKSPQGFTDGTVVEVLKSAKEVNGKQVKASKDDPRIVVKSGKSGKTAVHKVDRVYFD